MGADRWHVYAADAVACLQLPLDATVERVDAVPHDQVDVQVTVRFSTGQASQVVCASRDPCDENLVAAIDAHVRAVFAKEFERRKQLH